MRPIFQTAMVLIAGLIVGGAGGCGLATGYAPAQVPVHRLAGRAGPPAAVDSLTVVSWNIRYGAEVDLALRGLAADPRLAAADVLLLQEMDPAGSERIARALGFHLVHGSASVHPRHARLFGNAVLSRWPIRDGGAVVLPHSTPLTGHRRIAVWADIDLGESGVLRAVSVHAATPVVAQDRRFAQFAAPVDSLAGGADLFLYGGDFNTVSDYETTALRRAMRGRGLTAVSLPPGPTYRDRLRTVPGTAPVLDHLFVRGLAVGARGVGAVTAASDHLPVWVVLRPQNTTEQEAADRLY